MSFRSKLFSSFGDRAGLRVVVAYSVTHYTRAAREIDRTHRGIGAHSTKNSNNAAKMRDK